MHKQLTAVNLWSAASDTSWHHQLYYELKWGSTNKIVITKSFTLETDLHTMSASYQTAS